MSISAILASSAYQQDLGQLSDPRQASQSAHGQFIGLPLPAPIKADLESLATALQQGDLKQAQTAFSALVADMAAEYQRQEDSVSLSSS
jgi:hypothetical protein